MSATENLSDEEINRRYNHWDDIDIHFCKNCGSFVSPPEIENGQARYHCKSCDRHILEWIR